MRKIADGFLSLIKEIKSTAIPAWRPKFKAHSKKSGKTSTAQTKSLHMPYLIWKRI
jgi:hypothetical protein